jgi:hypothetical protein
MFSQLEQMIFHGEHIAGAHPISAAVPAPVAGGAVDAKSG